MAIFKILARDGSVGMIVRARCLTCARSVAVANAGSEGTRVWRDPELSRVELVRTHEYESTGPSRLIERIKHDAT